MANSIYEAVVERAKRLYPPDRWGAALIEGVSPLAKIALTARTARRTLRLVSIHVQSARETLEAAISAAEHAASGEPLSLEEELASHDEAIWRSCDIEASQGSKAAAAAGQVARSVVRCLTLPEPLYGESIVLTRLNLQHFSSGVPRYSRHDANSRLRDSLRAIMNLVSADSRQDANSFLCATFGETENDLEKLILYAEEVGDPWGDPVLDQGWDLRNDRGWGKMLDAAGIPIATAPDKIRDHWQRIHQAVRQSGRPFYPPRLFGPL